MKRSAASIVAQLIGAAQAALNPHDMAGTLLAVTRSVVELGVADMVGITERTRSEEFRTTAPTEDAVVQADHLQYRLNQGPCIQAIHDDAVLASNHVAADPRWSLWGPQAESSLGIRAVISAHLYTDKGSIGALNMYNREIQDYTSDDLEMARVFGSYMSVLLAQYRNEQHLWTAVDARHRIGLAQGILMHKYGIDEGTAFGLLRRLSQDQNVKLHLIADQVIRTRTVPNTPLDGPGGLLTQPSA